MASLIVDACPHRCRDDSTTPIPIFPSPKIPREKTCPPLIFSAIKSFSDSWYNVSLFMIFSLPNTISPNPVPSRNLQTVSTGIIILPISRHPVPPKRSPLSFPLLIWRYYQAFRIVSTASMPKLTGSGGTPRSNEALRVPLNCVSILQQMTKPVSAQLSMPYREL